MPIKISLKKLLFYNLILASIIPLIILFTFSHLWIKQDVYQEVKQKNELIAQTVVEHIQDYFKHFTPLLDSLIKRVGEKDFSLYIKKIQQDMQNIPQIIVTDQAGNIIDVAPYDSNLIGLDISKKDYFSQASETGYYFSQVHIDIMEGEPSVYVSKKKGKNTIILKIDICDLKNIFLQQEIEYFITDKNKIIIFSTHSEYQKKRLYVPWANHNHPEKFTQEVVFENKEYMLTYIPMSEILWGFSLLYEKEKAFLPINKVTTSLFVIFILVIIATALISTFIGQKILKPLERIRRKIKDVANGNYTSDIEMNGIVELNTAIYDIKHMALMIQQREEEIQFLKEKYEKIINTIPISLMVVSKEGKIVEWNQYSEVMFGYSRKEMIGQYNLTIPEEFKEQAEKMRKEIIEGQSFINYEVKRQTKQGEIKDLLASANVIELDNEKYVAIAYSDITEKKILENKLKQSLEESQMLLREIHHRIKNNLQVISGLLYIQSHMVQDPLALEAIAESQKRIKVMMIIHEMLYQTRKMAFIQVDQYITQLVKAIFESFVQDKEEIQYHLILEPIQLDPEVASNCGLILNELITNSLKYAFPEKKGNIEIEFKKIEKNIRMRIKDNGKGFDKEKLQKKGVGLEIVNALVKSLNATLTMNTALHQGTEFIIEFEKK